MQVGIGGIEFVLGVVEAQGLFVSQLYAELEQAVVELVSFFHGMVERVAGVNYQRAVVAIVAEGGFERGYAALESGHSEVGVATSDGHELGVLSKDVLDNREP